MSGSGPSHGYSRNNICKKTEVKFKTMLSNTIHEVDAASAGAVRSAATCPPPFAPKSGLRKGSYQQLSSR
jgi:hypothetical protein